MWRLRNDGGQPWPQGTKLVFVGGFGDSEAEYSVPIAKPGEMIEVAVDAVAPEGPGRYMSFYRLTAPDGSRFGDKLWLALEVVAGEALQGSGSGESSLSASASFHLPMASMHQDLGNPHLQQVAESSASRSHAANKFPRERPMGSPLGTEEGFSSLRSDEVFDEFTMGSEDGADDFEFITDESSDGAGSDASLA